jgi:hypothetical protein
LSKVNTSNLNSSDQPDKTLAKDAFDLFESNRPIRKNRNLQSSAISSNATSNESEIPIFNLSKVNTSNLNSSDQQSSAISSNFKSNQSDNLFNPLDTSQFSAITIDKISMDISSDAPEILFPNIDNISNIISIKQRTSSKGLDVLDTDIEANRNLKSSLVNGSSDQSGIPIFNLSQESCLIDTRSLVTQQEANLIREENSKNSIYLVNKEKTEIINNSSQSSGNDDDFQIVQLSSLDFVVEDSTSGKQKKLSTLPQQNDYNADIIDAINQELMVMENLVAVDKVNEEYEKISAKKSLIEFYSKHNPLKIPSVDEILLKYDGKFDELFSKLRKQYHVLN